MTVSDDKTPNVHIFKTHGAEVDRRLKDAFLALDRVETWLALTLQPNEMILAATEVRKVRRALADHV